jgi:pimeloyl-ACP methyl ester carboxylesterase
MLKRWRCSGQASICALALDSLTVMEAVMFLEDELEIDVFNDVASLDALVTVIDEHVDALGHSMGALVALQYSQYAL